jgi:hypothetical protein
MINTAKSQAGRHVHLRDAQARERWAKVIDRAKELPGIPLKELQAKLAAEGLITTGPNDYTYLAHHVRKAVLAGELPPLPGRGKNNVQKWPTIVARAAEIVHSYDTGVTLRQVFYRLVAEGTLENTLGKYQELSHHTAEARRNGDFPDLIDQGRTIDRAQFYRDTDEAREEMQASYRLDRTIGQPYTIVVGVEKATMRQQLWSWFSNLGLPIVATRGFASQTLVDEVRVDVEGYGRASVLIYAGDFDPSGDHILRDFQERTGCFDKVVRIAINEAQIKQYKLPVMPGKASDPLAARFKAEHGKLVQVELEALDPNILRRLYQKAIDKYFDPWQYQKVLRLEAKDRECLGGEA